MKEPTAKQNIYKDINKDKYADKDSNKDSQHLPTRLQVTNRDLQFHNSILLNVMHKENV